MYRGLCLLPTMWLCGCMALFEPPWSPPPAAGAAPGDCLAQATRNQPVTEGMQGVAIGAGAGAALGALIGGFAFGPAAAAVGWGALAGGVTGAGVGVLHGQQDQAAAYQACLDRHGATPPVSPGAQP